MLLIFMPDREVRKKMGKLKESKGLGAVEIMIILLVLIFMVLAARQEIVKITAWLLNSLVS